MAQMFGIVALKNITKRAYGKILNKKNIKKRTVNLKTSPY